MLTLGSGTEVGVPHTDPKASLSAMFFQKALNRFANRQVIPCLETCC